VQKGRWHRAPQLEEEEEEEEEALWGRQQEEQDQLPGSSSCKERASYVWRLDGKLLFVYS
jgi:hypothetical protein